ncbi:MAG TPA: hypothetical protein VK726_06280 [Acetobacteraceae bacterium]|nr:hypothetical protein [Acetobacteraceae bacterium]
MTLETRAGVLTATLPDGADDAVLTAAMPTLVMRGVRAISLHDAPIRDITPLAQLPGLVTRDAAGTRARDLIPLTGLVSLQSINLQVTPTRDLTPLAGHVDLRVRNLGGAHHADASVPGQFHRAGRDAGSRSRHRTGWTSA